MPLQLALAAMATRFELVLDGGDPVALRAAGEAALEEIAGVERRLSRFRRDSLVARLAEAGRAGVVATRDEIALLDHCRRAHSRTEGAFDPTLGATSFARFGVDRRGRRLVAPDGAPRLDLGGVGKGHALDRAVQSLRASGVERALLHGGTSSVAAIGAPPGQAGWRIGLRDPDDPRRTLATVVLRDASLSVSAPHGRTRLVAGRRLGHVVDPRDGEPVERARVAAVVARHGAVAETWSTALLVLLERRLRASTEDFEDAARALRLPPSLCALVAFDRDAALVTETFGPCASTFSLVPRIEAASEAPR